MKFAHHYSSLNRLGKLLPSRFKMRPDKVEERTQPFFIVSAGRSGSTLMASLLDKHSQISMPSEQFVLAQSIVKFNLFGWMQWEDLSAIICTEFIRTKGNQSWKLDARQLIDSVHAFPKEKRNLWDLLDHIYRSYGKDRQAEKRIWGDKTPSNHENIDIIQSVFKEARFICLIRDPRDVVNSYIRKKDESDDPQFGVDEWLRSIEKFDEIKKKLAPDQHLQLRYEDLVSHPEEEFKRIFEFLQLPFEAVHNQSNSDYLNKLGDVGNQDFMENVRKPINASAIGKWKKELSPEVLEQIQPRIQKGLERFGYLD